MSTLAFASPALAGNDESILLGDTATRTGGAVTANVADGAAIYYNPAGLSSIEHNTMNVSGQAFTLRFHSLPELIQTPDGQSGDAKYTEFTIVPATLSFVRPISERVRAGFGIFVVSAERAVFRSDVQYENENENLEEWLINEDYTTRDYRLGPSVSWKALDNLSLGTSVLFSYSQWTSATNFAGGEKDQVNGRFLTLGQTFNAWAVGAQLSLGAQWQPLQHLQTGLTLYSPGMQFVSRVAATESVSVSLDPDGMGNQSFFEAENSADLEWDLDVVQPFKVRAGVVWDDEWGWVGIDGDLSTPVTDAQLAIERDTNWNLRVGGELYLKDRMLIGAGLFTDRSPELSVDDFTERKIDFYGGTVGVRFGKVRTVTGEQVEKLFSSSSFSVRYAYGDGQLGGLRVQSLDGPDGEVLSTPATAARIHEISFQMGTTLAF